MIAGVLCQRKIAPSLYALDAQFDAFPFVDSAGHFTINNVSVAQASSDIAVFDGTHPQYLEFIGAETFDLQSSVDIEVLLTNTLGVSPSTHTIFELKGSTSYLVAQIYNFGVYAVFLTGATGGNTDNYSIVGTGTPLGLAQTKTLRVVYDAVAGTLKTYIDGILDINQSGITPRISESRVLYLSSITYPELHADVDYFRVKVG
jgi:hypothetical protein